MCPKAAIEIEDSFCFVKTIIDEKKCIKCGICTKVCQAHHSEKLNKPIRWYQGWAEDETMRLSASSGGIASAMTSYFMNSGGYVYSCMFNNGVFVFGLVSMHNFDLIKGSKYVKSTPKNVYKDIIQHVKNGKRVLFIGLPCQVAAIKLLVGDAPNLYTIDLICHGTPSVRLFNFFLEQNKIQISNVHNIVFRKNGHFGIWINNKPVTTPNTLDCYLIAFLKSLSYTENCYNCTYARLERCSDLTLGDSWGTEYKNELKKGISLILVQTSKGEDLINGANIHLLDVNINNAIANNAQLKEPSTKPPKRDFFFSQITKGKSFNLTIWKIYCFICLKQFIKGLLIKYYIVGKKIFLSLPHGTK
jgi:coenzyme F420-reducing hydrogenase beta subunit